VTAIVLAAVGALEAAVFLLRYRSAHHPSAAYSAATTGLVATLRVVFVWAGASAAFRGDGLGDVAVAAVAYAGSATLATWALHAWLNRRQRENAPEGASA